MFAKSIFFTNLLICSVSVFVSVKYSKTHDLGSSLTNVKNSNPFDPSSTLDSDFDFDDGFLLLPVDNT